MKTEKIKTKGRRRLTRDKGPHHREICPRGAYWFSEVNNLGDIVSPTIFEFFLGFAPHWVRPEEGPKWLGVGSILETAQPGDWVWGTGTKYEENVDAAGLKVVAVRGPRTASLLRNIQGEVAIGDPALLLPKIYVATVKYDEEGPVGFVPHYVDRDFIPYFDKEAIVIDVTNPNWMATVDAIAGCSLIISSSLHGIIIAEAYGVPAVWIQPSDRIFGGHHKFQDYYASTGRKGSCQPWKNSLDMLRASAEPPPNLASLQIALVDSLMEAVKDGR